MEYRHLGRAGVRVSALSLGTMTFGGRGVFALTGEVIGVKPAGGIRTAKDALRYLVTVHETAGPDWLDPARFRFGASSLLNDLLRQRRRLRTGAYAGADYLTAS